MPDDVARVFHSFLGSSFICLHSAAAAAAVVWPNRSHFCRHLPLESLLAGQLSLGIVRQAGSMIHLAGLLAGPLADRHC